jgi:hypothetical protein
MPGFGGHRGPENATFTPGSGGNQGSGNGGPPGKQRHSSMITLIFMFSI